MHSYQPSQQVVLTDPHPFSKWIPRRIRLWQILLFVWRMISGFPLRTLRDGWIWFSRSSRSKCLEWFIHWKITVTHTHTHFMVPASLLMVEIGVSSRSWSVVNLIWGQCAHSPVLISPCMAIKGLLWLLFIAEYPVILKHPLQITWENASFGQVNNLLLFP